MMAILVLTKAACSASCGVTPHAQKHGTSPGRRLTWLWGQGKVGIGVRVGVRARARVGIFALEL